MYIVLSPVTGLRGQRGSDTSATYSADCDAVDIDICYEPLHIPGAPPPYSPTCEDLELPPAYSDIGDNRASNTNTGSVYYI